MKAPKPKEGLDIMDGGRHQLTGEDPGYPGAGRDGLGHVEHGGAHPAAHPHLVLRHLHQPAVQHLQLDELRLVVVPAANHG